MAKRVLRAFFIDWIIPIIGALFVAFLLNNFVLFFAEIPSESMVPTLNKDDRVIITRLYNYENLNRGDIVVFHSEELNQDLIKRLIGLPGDHIEIIKGEVYINGEVLEEDYVKNNESLDYELSYDVPKEKYFFLGDNRSNSYDSRRWKNPYVDEKDIVGKAQLKIYPFNDFGSIK